MSDDEEILYKGKSLGLYNYLKDLGYDDFETFERENLPKGEQFQLHNDYPVDKYKERVNGTVNSPNTQKISDHDYRKLVTILNSQLLFKEDAYLTESLMHNVHVYSHTPNYVFHTSVVLTGLLSTVGMLRSKVNLGIVQYVVPGCTFLFSCYSAWKFYKELNENRKDFILMTHINELKKVCFNVLKLSQFLKETEILSTGQVPVNDIESPLHVAPSVHKNTHIDVLHQWKTLPHLRKYLSDTVEEVLNMLTISVKTLKQSLFDRELVRNHFISINRDNLKHCETSEKEFDGSITLVDLKELTSKYLCVQSEYLKELAIIFSCLFLEESIQHFSRDKVFKMCKNLDKKLIDISFKLMMQYKIHRTPSTFKDVSHKTSTRSHNREIYELQNGVHNVFLLLYSAMLRVRNLEDTLENLREIRKSSDMKDKLSLDVSEQLTVLKGDLISTVKCYDMLCEQVSSENKVETTKQDTNNKSNMIQVKINETGIVVGTSDFAVNSPDEVFLSLSGIINTEDTSISECVDDSCLERKPQIPKSLLTELSQTLKSRKTDFIQREKRALEKKGLQDIDSLSASSDEDSGESEDYFARKQDIISTKYKRHVAAQDYSHSSDSDDEMDPFESGAFLTKLKLSKKYQSDPYSDSDSSVQDVQLNEKTSHANQFSCNPSLSTPSVANLAALKSQMWGKNKEEYFSDGSDS